MPRKVLKACYPDNKPEPYMYFNCEIRENGNYYGSLSFYVEKVLRTTKLDKNTSWTERVASLMNKDTRLVRQNLVVESSL